MRFAPALLVLALGCTVTPPKPDIVRTGTSVNASMGRTWDAVIEQFATSNIPIRTIERASGLIATEQLSVPAQYYKGGYYDCGSSLGTPNIAKHAVYNALVRGDSSHATVRVSVKYSGEGRDVIAATVTSVDCTTQGRWETEFEAAVKAKAEAP